MPHQLFHAGHFEYFCATAWRRYMVRKKNPFLSEETMAQCWASSEDRPRERGLERVSAVIKNQSVYICHRNVAIAVYNWLTVSFFPLCQGYSVPKVRDTSM